MDRERVHSIKNASKYLANDQATQHTFGSRSASLKYFAAYKHIMDWHIMDY